MSAILTLESACGARPQSVVRLFDTHGARLYETYPRGFDAALQAVETLCWLFPEALRWEVVDHTTDRSLASGTCGSLLGEVAHGT
jgi:predicted nuclease with RNAse H fold